MQSKASEEFGLSLCLKLLSKKGTLKFVLCLENETLTWDQYNL